MEQVGGSLTVNMQKLIHNTLILNSDNAVKEIKLAKMRVNGGCSS